VQRGCRNVPKTVRETELKENHDSPSAGHVRSRRIIASLAAQYFWSGMHRDTRAHVRRCETCVRFMPNQMQAACKMLTQMPWEPWATVCQDFVGPLPRLRHGNQMLLVLIDRFSKWTRLVPLRSETAESLKKVFGESSPESSHIRQRSTVCQPNLQEFQATVHSSIHPAREPEQLGL